MNRKRMFAFFSSLALLIGVAGVAAVAHAEPSPVPSPSAVVAVMDQASVAPSPELPLADFVAQIMKLIHDFGGLSWALKISGIILLIIASMKVNLINSILWDRLAGLKIPKIGLPVQALVAPILGLIAGLLSVHPFSWAGVLAYMAAGAGAVLIHELLDIVKAIPGIGQVYVAAIDWIEQLLDQAKAEAK